MKNIRWQYGQFSLLTARFFEIHDLFLFMCQLNLSAYKLAFANYVSYLTGKHLTCQPFPKIFLNFSATGTNFSEIWNFFNFGVDEYIILRYNNYCRWEVSAKLQMESWLSGRRRTTGNRVTVMSGSRVQIPNSPPLKRLETLVSGLFSYLRIKKTAAGIYGSLLASSK